MIARSLHHRGGRVMSIRTVVAFTAAALWPLAAAAGDVSIRRAALMRLARDAWVAWKAVSRGWAAAFLCSAFWDWAFSR